MGLTPISLPEMKAMDIKDPEWLVDGLIVAGSATILTGREKSGKGLLSIDLACSLASDMPWIGRAVMGGPVIYLALEESIRTLRDRILKWTEGRTDIPLYIISADGSTDDSFAVEDPDRIEDLINVIRMIDPVLVIIDTLRESHSGREDSSDDMAPRLRPIRQIAHQLDVTLIVTHHQSKMAGASRGSTAIRASFDDEIAFTRTDEESDTTIAGRLRVEGRNVPKQTVYINFEPESARWSVNNLPEEQDVSLRGRIRHLLEDENTWLSAREIAEKLPNTKLKTVQNELSRLVKDRSVVTSGAGTKSAPRKYSSPNRRLDIVPDDSGNYAGNDGNEDWRAA